jgi:thioredoxin 1
LEEIVAGSGDTDLSAYEVDIVEDMPIAQKYFVLGVPTIIVFKEGKEIRRFNSVPKKEKIIDALK